MSFLTNGLKLKMNFLLQFTSLFLLSLFTLVNLSTSTCQPQPPDSYPAFLRLLAHCDGQTSNFKPQFSKLVLVLIDALRVDFLPTVASSQFEPHDHQTPAPRMPWIEGKVATSGISLISVAQMPTVTLPRLKALLSGSIPSFRDYVLNLNAYAFTSDNLISSLANSGRRLVFYGDDTWGKLFPAENQNSPFVRSELTSSFFVTDTITVDSNVTRNVHRELTQLDSWEVMALHYLGLDHIGHSQGYHSPMMTDKLLEMDQVVELIYGTLQQANESALIVVTGDHGMTNDGNHGGATREETNTPLIFLSTSKQHQKWSSECRLNKSRPQIDFTSTLASLFRLPIPSSNRGVLIDQVLRRFDEPPEVQLCSLFSASVQLQSAIPSRSQQDEPLLFQELKSTLEAGMRYHELHLRRFATNAEKSVFLTKAVEAYRAYLQSVQLNFFSKRRHDSKGHFLLLFLIAGVLSVIVGLFVLEWRRREWSIIFVINSDVKRSPSTFFLIQRFGSLLLIVTHILSLSSTSFIQSEHRFWNTAAAATTLLLIISSFLNSHKKSLNFYLQSALTIALLYLTLNWRQTELTSQWGDTAEENLQGDIYSVLKRPENKALASLVFICSLCCLGWSFRNEHNNLLLKVLQFSGLALSYCYRSSTGSLLNFLLHFTTASFNANTFAQLLYLHAAFLVAAPFAFNFFRYSFSRYSKGQTFLLSLLSTLSLLATLLLDPFTAPVFTLNVLLEGQLDNLFIRGKDNLKHPEHIFLAKNHLFTRLTVYLVMATSAFYQVGNSNSLSTVSVTACFIGLSSYQLLPCTVLMLLATYSTHLFWLLAFFRRLQEEFKEPQRSFEVEFKEESRKSTSKAAHCIFNSVLTCWMLIRLGELTAVLVVTLALRDHPFIWSVLSPKLLYELLLFFMHLLVAFTVTASIVPSFIV